MSPIPHRCCVCLEPADKELTSAHFAGVWRFCTKHGQAFHQPSNLEVIRSCPSTLEQWKAIDAWVLIQRALA